jgi:transposase
MVLRPQPIPPVPTTTAAAVRAAFPKGNLLVDLRAEFGTLVDDTVFADLYPADGRPVHVAPWRLALVLILQYLEGLTDRQAADAVRRCMDWKYLLSLDLHDPGFDFTLLHDFRERLISSDSAQGLFDHLLAACTARGLIKHRGTQRTDSTRVLAAVRSLSQLECVLEAIHWLLNQLTTENPAWVQAHIPPEWFTRYGFRAEQARFPKADAARERFALTMAADGYQLMTWLDVPSTPPALRALPSLHALRLIWIQQFYSCTIPGHETIQMRTSTNKPLSALVIQSPYDLEARWCQRNNQQWVGYKVHMTETCDPGYPDLITHIATVPATEHDSVAAPRILADLDQRRLLPATQLVDAGYMNAQLLMLGHGYNVNIVGPTLLSNRRQQSEGAGYAVDNFQLDWERQIAICPQGHPSRGWWPIETGGKSCIRIGFRSKTCRVCPVRAACTSAKVGARQLTIYTHDTYMAMQAARQRETTDDFKHTYALRSGVESTMAQHTQRFDGRTSRYRGLRRTHLQQLLVASATNLVRVIAWLWNEPLDEQRRPPGAFARYTPHRLSRRAMVA